MEDIVNSSKKDIALLQRLGEEIVKVGSLPIQEERRLLWKRLNEKKAVRPMVIVDELPWHEMNLGGKLDCHCENEACRRLETELRRTLFRHQYFACDYVVEPYIQVGRPIYGLDYGMGVTDEKLAGDKGNDVVSHHYLDQLVNEDDLQKIKNTKLYTDDAAFSHTLAWYESVFDGIAPIKVVNGQVFGHFMDLLVMWHGAENMLYDLVDRPELVHAMMARMTEVSLSYIDQLNEMQLYEERQPMIHCSGGYWDFKDTGLIGNSLNAWTFGTSQLFANVSEDMHEEFEVPYLSRLFEKFGNVYYGCCEPLHNKMNLVRKYKNVSKISISPWSNVKIASEKIGSDYVLSNKPNPARLAGVQFDESLIKSELQESARVCRENGTPLEFILKDISTVKNDPTRILKWAEIAMKVAREYE